MYIYNVTINIAEDVHNKWVKWMKETHIPEMLNTGKFIKALMSRVMVEEEMGGITYAIQYTAKNKTDLENYYKEDAEALRAKSAIFEGKFVAFRTELEVISQHEENT